MEGDPDRWLREHPKVEVTLPDRPEGDWRAETGWGWIAKFWFRTWGTSRTAKVVIADAGWQPKFWGRKLRVGVSDGYDAQRIAQFVLDRWPEEVRAIQLRCD